eukprot:scaffold2090_cov225-Prasinococcus_capsulatus_cf.AAC.29
MQSARGGRLPRAAKRERGGGRFAAVLFSRFGRRRLPRALERDLERERRLRSVWRLQASAAFASSLRAPRAVRIGKRQPSCDTEDARSSDVVSERQHPSAAVRAASRRGSGAMHALVRRRRGAPGGERGAFETRVQHCGAQLLDDAAAEGVGEGTALLFRGLLAALVVFSTVVRCAVVAIAEGVVVAVSVAVVVAVGVAVVTAAGCGLARGPAERREHERTHGRRTAAGAQQRSDEQQQHQQQQQRHRHRHPEARARPHRTRRQHLALPRRRQRARCTANRIPKPPRALPAPPPRAVRSARRRAQPHQPSGKWARRGAARRPLVGRQARRKATRAAPQPSGARMAARAPRRGWSAIRIRADAKRAAVLAMTSRARGAAGREEAGA